MKETKELVSLVLQELEEVEMSKVKRGGWMVM